MMQSETAWGLYSIHTGPQRTLLAMINILSDKNVRDLEFPDYRPPVSRTDWSSASRNHQNGSRDKYPSSLPLCAVARHYDSTGKRLISDKRLSHAANTPSVSVLVARNTKLNCYHLENSLRLLYNSALCKRKGRKIFPFRQTDMPSTMKRNLIKSWEESHCLVQAQNGIIVSAMLAPVW